MAVAEAGQVFVKFLGTAKNRERDLNAGEVKGGALGLAPGKNGGIVNDGDSVMG